ncbi:MAG: DUF4304 domain-containing protein [Kangiellaceae bacterium]|nr:DUF4304 domain-containing protein [Kangiellaceae bacterium]
MSEISKIIDGIIKAELAPHLKQCGFKKKARNFYREHSDRTEMINIQASQWNEGLEGKFTVNVGVYYPEISKLIDAPPVKGLPKEYDCTIRERIGLIAEENRDTWWNVNPDTDQDVVANDLASKVKLVCLPWLELMSELDNVKTGVVKNNRAIVAAGISLHQGNAAEAKEYLEQSFKQQPLAKSRASAWGKKHGLIQP